MDFLQEATSAIESMVVIRHKDYDLLRWLPIKPIADPMEGWGSEPEAWHSDGFECVDTLNRRLGLDLDVADHVMEHFGSEQLIQYRNFLAIKAEDAAAHRTLARTRAILAGLE